MLPGCQADYAHDMSHVPQADSGYGAGRRRFLTQAAAAALPTFLVPSLAAADSTGKFSSKVGELCAAPLHVEGEVITNCTARQRTAKNRYVPRIKKGIAAFEQVRAL